MDLEGFIGFVVTPVVWNALSAVLKRRPGFVWIHDEAWAAFV
jgi:hypothetical protein